MNKRMKYFPKAKVVKTYIKLLSQVNILGTDYNLNSRLEIDKYLHSVFGNITLLAKTKQKLHFSVIMLATVILWQQS